jgi:hypothetical protein
MMRSGMRVGTLLVASFGVSSGAHAGGPDLALSDIYETFRYGTLNGQSAYAIGNWNCNVGDEPVAWDVLTDNHPVFGFSVHRVLDGRLEQIGLSWVKHAFSAVNLTRCQTCTFNGHDGSNLYPGCADAYSAPINGAQTGLGPRSQVNATSGAFTFPVDYSVSGPATNVLSRRIPINNTDLDPAQNAGAIYLIEAQAVAPDDAAAGNDSNNTAVRRTRITGSGTNFNLTLSAGDQNQAGLCVVEAWAQLDPTVLVSRVRVPGEGLIAVASKVQDRGGGVRRYIYAIQNLNSDRAIGSFTIPRPDCIVRGASSMRQPVYHSGDAWSNAPWTVADGPGTVVWSVPQSFEANPMSSAVRWGTVLSVWFDASAESRVELATVGMFKPGGVGAVGVAVHVPRSPADFNSDGFVDFFDFDDFVLAFEGGEPGADINRDGFLDFFDFDDFVVLFGSGC